jgi:hypothetical protein
MDQRRASCIGDGSWSSVSSTSAWSNLLVAWGLQQSLRPLQIPSPIDIAGHPRCLALYPHRILKIYLAPKHAIETAQLFCLLNDVVDFWSRHVKLLE